MEAQTSRSVIVKKFGGYDTLRVEEFKLPELKGHIEVEVEYGGLNFFDLYTRQGLLPHRKLPFVLGMECTGTITALGVEDTDLKVGQKVICYDYNGGLYREKLRVKPENCYLLPDFVDLKIGASLFVNYVTAYVSLFEIGNLRKNENVLIMSCAGGVGCAATQLAKTIEGVQIFGTGSKQKEEEAKGNGVDVFYAYDTFQSEAAKNKFDIIVTNQTGPILTFLQGILNPLGRIVITGAANLVPNETKISVFSLLKVWWSMKNISIESLIMNNRIVAGLHMGTLIECDREKVKTALNYIFDLYKEGKIKPVIHAEWPMSKIVDATKELGTRKNVGKVLIYMKESSDEVAEESKGQEKVENIDEKKDEENKDQEKGDIKEQEKEVAKDQEKVQDEEKGKEENKAHDNNVGDKEPENAEEKKE